MTENGLPVPLEIEGRIINLLDDVAQSRYREVNRRGRDIVNRLKIGYNEKIKQFVETIDSQASLEDKFNAICQRIRDSKPLLRGKVHPGISAAVYEVTKRYLLSLPTRKRDVACLTLLEALASKDELQDGFARYDPDQDMFYSEDCIPALMPPKVGRARFDVRLSKFRAYTRGNKSECGLEFIRFPGGMVSRYRIRPIPPTFKECFQNYFVSVDVKNLDRAYVHDYLERLKQLECVSPLSSFSDDRDARLSIYFRSVAEDNERNQRAWDAAIKELDDRGAEFLQNSLLDLPSPTRLIYYLEKAKENAKDHLVSVFTEHDDQIEVVAGLAGDFFCPQTPTGDISGRLDRIRAAFVDMAMAAV